MNDELERIAQLYAGPRFRERQRVRVERFLAYSSEEWALDEFIAILAKIKAEMPAGADDATVEFEAGAYDESSKFAVSYYTWEDLSAVEKRVNDSLAYARGVQAAERRKYEELKAKFET